MTPRVLLLLAALVVILVIAVGVIVAGRKVAPIELELPASGAAFHDAVNGREDVVLATLYVDFAFVLAYAAFFALFNRFVPGPSWAAIASTAAILAAAVLDVGENAATIATLRQDPADVRTIAGFAVAKWVCFFVAAALLQSRLGIALGWAVAVLAAIGLGPRSAPQRISRPPRRSRPRRC